MLTTAKTHWWTELSEMCSALQNCLLSSRGEHIKRRSSQTVKQFYIKKKNLTGCSNEVSCRC